MADFKQLLIYTSRTFGLSIPLLAEPHQRRLTFAYLLFRVADTLEDAEGRPRDQKTAALEALLSVLKDDRAARWQSLADQWSTWAPSEHAGYQQLLREFPALMSAIAGLGSPARQIILSYASRTVAGMLEFVESGDARGNLRLHTLAELRRYCYTVAGLVGEMITDLFLAHEAQLQPVAGQLSQHAASFGEGLQLVNILKDAQDDARSGRFFLPAETTRDTVFDLARQDLGNAETYLATLKGCAPGQGLVPFTELPIRLAWRTLDRVQRCGSGAKLSRSEVSGILQQVEPRVP